MNIDELRRKLRLTEQELVKTKGALKGERTRNEELRKEVSDLEGKMHTVVETLFPGHRLEEVRY